MKITEKIGLRIKELRIELSYSQQELSYRSDIDRTYITQVENGKRNISIINIEKVAKALGVSMKELFNNEKFNDDTNKQ